MTERTVRLHRVLRSPPERIYRAFTQASAMAKWLPPYGFTCTVHQMDARVGGRFRMSFHHFSSGNAHLLAATPTCSAGSTSNWCRIS